MSNDKSTPTSSSVWGKLDEKPSETPTHTPVTGAEKWGEVFGDVPSKEQLKNMEEAAKLYYEVKTKMLSEGRNP
jgi:hypothetical protein